jgi:hypothetical protein
MSVQGYVLYLAFLFYFCQYSERQNEGREKEAEPTRSMALIIRKGWLCVGKKEVQSMTTRPWTQIVGQQVSTKEVRAKYDEKTSDDDASDDV